MIVDKAKAFIFFIYFSLFYFVFCIIHKVLYKVIITFSNNICTNFIKLYYFTMLALRLALYSEKVWGNFEICWRFIGGFILKNNELFKPIVILVLCASSHNQLDTN